MSCILTLSTVLVATLGEALPRNLSLFSPNPSLYNRKSLDVLWGYT